MKNYQQSRKAFSIIEVIFVLIILGIISSIGSSIIVQVYESYITQNALYKVAIKTELIANQLVNRLTYAIPLSTISKVTNANGIWINPDNNLSIDAGNPPDEDANWIQLKNIMFGTSTFRTIEWIGYDNDSFSADRTAGWSGIANYNTSTNNILNTPDSNLSNTRDIILNLSNNRVDINNPISTALPVNNSAVVIFKEKNNYFTGNSFYDPSCMGLINYTGISVLNQDSSCIFPVQRASDTQLTFQRANESKWVTERYKLAWSAYAVVPENPTDTDGDGDPDLWELAFYYNYQPWNGENYKAHGTRRLLMRNVSVFKFTKNGGIIQFKLCASSQISTNNYISTCKEKVVLR